MSPLDDKFQRGLIITDDISPAPILDFNYYKQVITDIIKKSYPKFSIGIFGEWGTGKTTLMKNVYNELEKERIQSVVPVWFNAWRYERENQFALFPLLQTIAYSIPDKDKEKEKLKEAIGKFGRGFLKGLIKSIPEFASAVLPSAISEPLKKTTDNVANEISTEFMSMLDKISQSIISETLYSTHLENIETAIADIRKNEDFKIVVFIDDLDRCSPTKALEVLESTKVFLDLDGFIFVMGLSYNKISQLITAAYKEIGIEGEQYLKKIIQIPINLPLWTADDIEKLVTNFVDKGIINDNYHDIIKNNISLISAAIENNPREIKRFLNNFIIIYELSKLRKNFNPIPENLLLMQAIQLRWNSFYEIFIISNKQFRSELKKYVSLNQDERKMILDLDKIEKDNEQYKTYNESIRQVLKQFKNNSNLWNLLSKHLEILEIENLEPYRRATEVVKEPIIQRYDTKNYPKIFVSYSRRDGDNIAFHIKNYLSVFNYDVFTDIDRIKLGESWSHNIEHNISNCDVFVVIVTDGALNSWHVEREVLQAQKEKKTIVPCIHTKVNYVIKWGLDKIKPIKFSDNDELAVNLYNKLYQLL